MRRYRGEAIYRPLLVFLGTVAAAVLLYVAGLIVLTGRLGVASAITLATALLSLYSIITLTAHLLTEKGVTCVRSAAWYDKMRPTFSDAIALVRRQLWEHIHFSTSPQETDMIKIPRELFDRFIDAVCYAA